MSGSDGTAATPGASGGTRGGEIAGGQTAADGDTRAANGSAPLLALDHVDAGYGPFRAIFGVSLQVARGSAVALLGPNGAGKTTVARVCTGLVRPTAGHIQLDGRDVAGVAPYRLARAGVIHATEGRSVFATLSVEENLLLAFSSQHDRGSAAQLLDRAYDLFPRLGERRRQLAGMLSGGEQRMLSLARVLVLAPRLLVADELSLGLAPVIVEEAYATLRAIKDEGTALLLIEQQVEHALALADRAVVLSHGEVTYDGAPDRAGEIAERVLPGARR
jgi:branched-chain amino acid transport system ATP-binding protein